MASLSINPMLPLFSRAFLSRKEFLSVDCFRYFKSPSRLLLAHCEPVPRVQHLRNPDGQPYSRAVGSPNPGSMLDAVHWFRCLRPPRIAHFLLCAARFPGHDFGRIPTPGCFSRSAFPVPRLKPSLASPKVIRVPPRKPSFALGVVSTRP